MKGAGRSQLITVLLILLLLSAYAYFLPRWANWNQNSRMDVVLAVVDQGTLSIDAYVENTGDYALYGGHYYGEKAPGMSFLGIPFYWAFKATLGRAFTENLLPAIASNRAATGTLPEGGQGLVPESLYFATALYIVTFFTVALPSALFGGLMYRFLGCVSDSVKHRAGVTVLYGLATIAFPYSGSYYGHQLAAVLLFTAFWMLFRMRGTEPDRRVLLLIGFLLGYSTITEYPTVFAAVVLFIYGLSIVGRKTEAAWMIAGGLPPVVALLLYNTAIFGRPWEFSYKYSELWIDYHHTGFFGTTVPSPIALWGITLSPYRGLFFLSPFLLLAVPGFYLLWRQRRCRREVAASLAIIISLTLFNASSAMWFGGHSVGPRYLVPMLPFMVWPVVVFFDCARKWRGAGPVVVGLAVISLLFVWVETISGQQFPQYSRRPLLDYSIPRLLQGDIARNLGTLAGLPGAYSLLPLLALMSILVVAVAWSTKRVSREASGPAETKCQAQQDTCRE